MQTTRCLLTVDPPALGVSSKRKRDAEVSNVRHQADDNSNSKVAKTGNTSDTTSRHEKDGNIYSVPPIAAIRGDDIGSHKGNNQGQSAAHASSASGATVCQRVSDGDSSIDTVALAPVTNDAVTSQRASKITCMPATALANDNTATIGQANEGNDAKLASASTQGCRAVTQQAADGRRVPVPSTNVQQLEDNKLAAAPGSKSTTDTTISGASQQAVKPADGRKLAVKSDMAQAVRYSAEGNEPAAAAVANNAVQGKGDSAPQDSLQFYQISLVQMQAGCFPLPVQLRNGQSMLPINFVASHNTGETLYCVHHNVRWLTLTHHYHKHQSVCMEVL